MNLIKATPFKKEELDDYIVFECGGGAGAKLQGGYNTGLAQLGIIQNAAMIGGTSAGGLNAGISSVYGGILSDVGPSEDLDVLPIPAGIEPDLSDVDIMNPPQPFLDGIAIWENIKTNKDVYTGTINTIFDKIGAGFGFVFGADSILGAKPFYAMIDEIFGEMTLKDASECFGIEVSLTATDLNTMRAVFFTSFNPDTQNYKLGTIMKATSAIPGIFPSVPIKMPNGETHWFVDGGTIANNPFVAYTKYNDMFPDKRIKKAIILYCYPDAFIDDGLHITAPEDGNKKYQDYKDALLRTIPAMLNGQEQVAEMFIEDKVKHNGWDIGCYFPQEAPCDPLDFGVKGTEQKGYNQVMTGKIHSYKEDKEIPLADFVKRKD